MPTVSYVASLKTRVGVDRENIEARTLKEALLKISSRVPDLLDYDGKTTGLYVILVNDVDYRLLDENHELREEDNITVIPVIHGG